MLTDSQAEYYYHAKYYSMDLSVIEKEKCTFNIEKSVVHTSSKVIKLGSTTSGKVTTQYEVSVPKMSNLVSGLTVSLLRKGTI